MRNPASSFLLIACVALVTPASVVAQTIQLAGLVGQDVGLCVELHDARSAVERVEHSPWLERLKGSRLFQGWMQSDDVRRFRQSAIAMEKVVSQPPRKFLLGLFGQQAIVAVYPQAEGDPIAIVLTRAESDAAILHAIKVWNESEPTQIDVRTHAGKSYSRRVRTQRKDRPAETMFYFHEGTFLALSDREDLIRQAISRIDAGTEGSIADHDAWKSLHGEDETATIRALIQPQVWRKGKEPGEPLDPLPSLLRSWRSCESITVTARLEDGLVMQAAAYFPKDSASPRWLRFIERSRGAFPLFERIPAEALFVIATRIDLSETAALVDELVPVSQRKPVARLRQVARGLLLGLDLPGDVLPNLGPEFTAWIAPHPKPAADSDDNALPWEAAAVWALKSSSSEVKADGGETKAKSQRRRASVPTAIDNALNTGLNLLVALFNADEQNEPAILQDESLSVVGSSNDANGEGGAPKPRLPQTRLRWVEGIPFVQPAFAASVDRLLFSTNPESIRRVLNVSKPEEPAPSLASAAAFQMVQKRMVASPTQLAYVNVAGVRKSLVANKARIVRHAVKNGEKSEDVEKKLTDIGDLLSLFDDVFLALRLDDVEVRATFGATLRR